MKNALWRKIVWAATSVSFLQVSATGSTYSIAGHTDNAGTLAVDIAATEISTDGLQTAGTTNRGNYTVLPATGTAGVVIDAMTSSDTFTLDSSSKPAILEVQNTSASTSYTVDVPITFSGTTGTFKMNPQNSGNFIILGSSSTLTGSAGNILELNGPGTLQIESDSSAFAGTTLLDSGSGTLSIVSGAKLGGVLSLQGGTAKIAGDFTGSAIHNGGTLQFNQSSGTKTIASALGDGAGGSPVGTLTINGDGSSTGLVQLTGATTYSGATTVSKGTLSLQGANRPTGAFTITTGATLDLANSADAIYSNDISGAGTLTINGNGSNTKAITLSGSAGGYSSFTGGVNIKAGTLKIQDGFVTDHNTHGSGIGFTGSSNLEFNVASGTSGSPTIYSQNITQSSGTGAIQKTGAGYLKLTGTNAATGTTTITGGQLEMTVIPGGNLVIDNRFDSNVAGYLTLGANGSYTHTLSGAGPFTLQGGHVLDLSSGSTSGYTGSVTLTGTGTGMTLSDNSMLNGVTVGSGATLTFNNSSEQIAGGPITGAGSVVVSGSGRLNLANATHSGGTTVSSSANLGVKASSLQGNFTHNGNYIYADLGTDKTYSGVISGSGNFGINQSGSGNLTLSAVQTYTGWTKIYQGSVIYGVDDVLSSSSKVYLQENGAGTLDLNGKTGTIRNLTCTDTTGTVNLGSGGNLTINLSENPAYRGAFSGTGQMTFHGTQAATSSNFGHQIELGGDNASWGDNATVTVIIDSTRVYLGHASALGRAPVTISNYGSIDLNGKTYASTISGLQGTIYNTAGTGTVSSGIPLTGASNIFARAGSPLVVNGSITGSGNLTFTGGATITVNADQAHIGNTTVVGNATDYDSSSSANVQYNADIYVFDGKTYTVTNSTVQLNSKKLYLSSNGSSDATMTMAGSSQLQFVGSSGIQLDPGRHVGTLGKITGSSAGGLGLNSSSTTTSTSNYGKTIQLDTPVTGSGAFTQSGLGTTQFTQTASYTGATTINGGTVSYNHTAMGTLASAITINNYSTLSLVPTANASMGTSATIAGNGHLVVTASTYTATVNGATTYTGNTTLNSGNLTFAGNVTLGANSLITMGDRTSLKYGSSTRAINITPVGASFAPVLASGATSATWTLDNATIVTTSLTGPSLNVGLSSQGLTIGSNGLTITAGKPVTVLSSLVGSGNLTVNGTSSVTLINGSNTSGAGNAYASYTGAITVGGTASLFVDQEHPGTVNLSAGNGTNIFANITSDVTWSNVLTGTSTATFTKNGSSALTFNASGKIDQFAGTINVRNGSLRLQDTSLHASSSVNVSPLANLDVFRQGASSGTISMHNVTLSSRGNLRLLAQTGPNGSSATLNQVHIDNLSISNGSVLVVQYDPSTGGTTTPAYTTAPLAVDTLTRSGNDRLYVQFRPISTTAPTANNIYALITAGSGGSEYETTLAQKISLYPSIIYNTTYGVSLGAGSASTFYGNLFAYGAGSHPGSADATYGYGTLYVKIVGSGAWAGVVSGNPSSASLPTKYYGQTGIALLGQIDPSQIMPYSGLDQYVTSMMMNGMSSQGFAALSPEAALQATQMISQHSLKAQSLVNQGFTTVCQEQSIGMMLKEKGLSSQQRQIAATQLMDHHQLQSSSTMKTHGQWRGWTLDQGFTSFSNDQTLIQNVQMNSTGISFAVAPTCAIGYQMLSGKTSYQSTDDAVHGQAQSRYAQGLAAVEFNGLSVKSQVSAFQHDVQHHRTISAVFFNGELQESWTAQSQQKIQGASLDQEMLYALNSQIGLGFHVRSDVAHYSAYQEQGADDLNLSIGAHTQAQMSIKPVARLGFQSASDTQWMVGSFQVGYQFQPYALKNEMTVGMDAYHAQTQVPFAPQQQSGIALGFDMTLGSMNGFSLQTSAQAVAHDGEVDHNTQVSVSFAF